MDKIYKRSELVGLLVYIIVTLITYSLNQIELSFILSYVYCGLMIVYGIYILISCFSKK